MHFMCLLTILASILANTVGDNHVQTVNVTCRYTEYREICTITHLDYHSKAPHNLNILNADDTTDIISLQMTNGNYTTMPLNLFQLFPQLLRLKISTGLEAITNEKLSGGNKLKFLDLSYNKITAINAHTFDGMAKLEEIILEGNKLTKVLSNAFAGATSLKKLDFKLNEIETIEEGAFNIPTLEIVDLSHNKLETLEDDVFVGCPEMKTIFLSSNKLTRIGKSIENVEKLGFISFDNRLSFDSVDIVKIVDFDFYAIARKPNLEYFSSRSVGLILNDAASAANNDSYTVKRLDIIGNGLSHPDILHRLKNFQNLTNLSIAANNFTTINDLENILEMFPKLIELDVRLIPCKDDVIQRLRTKFGDVFEVGGLVIFN